mmetsp:Transcript_35000/g.112837  ORF Transcript_35000/g.112837 Transcript_35000/m.112837 type:complete len:254 (+) Transcript_35000:336-1097(+)
MPATLRSCPLRVMAEKGERFRSTWCLSAGAPPGSPSASSSAGGPSTEHTVSSMSAPPERDRIEAASPTAAALLNRLLASRFDRRTGRNSDTFPVVSSFASTKLLSPTAPMSPKRSNWSMLRVATPHDAASPKARATFLSAASPTGSGFQPGGGDQPASSSTHRRPSAGTTRSQLVCSRSWPHGVKLKPAIVRRGASEVAALCFAANTAWMAPSAPSLSGEQGSQPRLRRWSRKGRQPLNRAETEILSSVCSSE